MDIKNLETRIYGEYNVRKGLKAVGEVLHHDKLTSVSAGLRKKLVKIMSLVEDFTMDQIQQEKRI